MPMGDCPIRQSSFYAKPVVLPLMPNTVSHPLRALPIQYTKYFISFSSSVREKTFTKKNILAG
jgi:hypothetical protein